MRPLDVSLYPARVRSIVIVLAVVACGKSKSGEPSQGGEPERMSNHAVAATPLQSVTEKTGKGDASGVAFTIDLPMAALGAPERTDTAVSWEPKKAWLDSPTFTILYSDMPMQADDTGDPEPFGEDAKERVIARAEKLPDGGYLNLDQRNDHRFFNLEVCRPVPKGKLCCTVIERGDKPLDAFDEIVGLAEKVCRSMKAKG